MAQSSLSEIYLRLCLDTISDQIVTVLQWLGDSGQYQGLLADLTRPFTEAEVAAAFGASQRGKACGPDRLGNDWYRDFGDQLIPIMTILYNCWYPRGTFPATFLEADIFCLKKGGESAGPLNFRPLALLNTDYKLLTRMTATRTSGKLSAIVHPNQNGFVPFRTVHSKVDLFTAAQAAATTDPTMARALALLLDFMKAYDSVDREFLYAVLRWLGFPDEYVQVMHALHDGTKVRFLANGYKSRWVSVTCGIRQGCPLAPLLFLLVLEALYRRIDVEPSVRGIVLKSAAGEVTLKVGGYADDTASYVRSVLEVVVILEITRLFAFASGLRLNEHKTLVIALNPAAIPLETALPSPLKVQAVTKLSRYLGLPVGSVPDVAYTWRLARTLLVTRLALAARKTMTADQRSMVVMAVVIPKLLYIGRHHWPTTELVANFQKMIENFVWHARFSADAVAGRSWINRHVATLPRREGGLAVPNLKLDLLAHAAVTVNTWAIEADTTTLVVGDVLAGTGASGPAPMLYVSPRATLPPKTGPRLRDTIWTTGVHLCNAYGGVMAVTDMVRALHCLQYFRGPIPLTWRGRRLIIATSTLSGHLWTRYTTAEALQHGDFCVEWLPYLVLKDLRLYSEKGTTVNPVLRFWSICAAGAQIKDVLHWTWTRQHRLVVTILCKKVTKTIQRQVGHLMRLLLLNFPQLVLPGDHSGRVRYSTRGDGGAQIQRCVTSDRHLTGQGGGVADEWSHPGYLHSHRELTWRMQRDVGPTIKIDSLSDRVHPHPRLARNASRMACLWKGDRRWKATRQYYKTTFGAKRVQKGASICLERQTA